MGVEGSRPRRSKWSVLGSGNFRFVCVCVCFFRFSKRKKYCYGLGDGVDVDRKKSAELLERAALLGHVESMHHLGTLLPKTNPARFEWMGEAALRSGVLVEFLTESLDASEAPGTPASQVFALGAALRSRPALASGSNISAALAMRAQKLVELHRDTCEAARRAVRAWTRVGIRQKVVRDVRLIIAKMIWGSRSECEYLLPLQPEEDEE
jgi:hypothetical protein